MAKRTNYTGRKLTIITVALASVAMVACGRTLDDDGPASTPIERIDWDRPNPFPLPSAEDYEFVSAYEGNRSSASTPMYDEDNYDYDEVDMGSPVFDSADTGSTASADTGVESGPSNSAPTVERGDIFSRLGKSHLLNLNPYRGLQVIDIADLSEPRIVGRLPLEGSPFELQLLDEERAFLFFQTNNGQTEIVEIDLSDLENPTVVDELTVNGSPVTTRLISDDANAALYVVTQSYGDYYNDGSSDGSAADMGYDYVDQYTVISGVDLNVSPLEVTGEARVEGYASAVQATSEYLMVANESWEDPEHMGRVDVFDISDVSGDVLSVGEVMIAGRVNDLFGLDAYNGVLRVVSNTWEDNVVETFDLLDERGIMPLGRHTFGDNEQLFATIFLGNKAFFVTFRQTDPFHAFRIDDDGTITEMSEYIVSGWNEFFAPVFGGNRLIGIGFDDNPEGPWGQSLAVSLYDSENLENSEPMLARAHIGSGWSEATWDDRAFTVIEGAARVENADGTIESGLLLLPFESYDYEWDGEASMGVQLFTFSESTLTERGILWSGDPVRRAFGLEEDAVGSLSNSVLGLHDASNPDAPEALAHLDLAPNFVDVFGLGEFVARVRANSTSSNLNIEIVPVDENLDLAQAVHVVAMESNVFYRVGDLAVGIEADYGTDGVWVEVADLSNPSSAGMVAARALTPLPASAVSYCHNCSSDTTHVADEALVIVEQAFHEEVLGWVETCTTYSAEWDDYCWEQGGDCSYYEGSITCTTRQGEETTCDGAILRCDAQSWECTPVDRSTVQTTTDCYQYNESRYWNSPVLHVLDLTDPTNPEVARVVMPEDEESAGVHVQGDAAYFGFAQPVQVEGDDRGYAAHFVREIDLSDPGAPVTGEPINVPGVVIGVDASNVITLDRVWGADGRMDNAIAAVALGQGRATLLDRIDIGTQSIAELHAAGPGRWVSVLNNYDCYYAYDGDYYDYEGGCSAQEIRLLLLAGDDLRWGGTVATFVSGQLLLADAERIAVQDGQTVTIYAIDGETFNETASYDLNLSSYSYAVRVVGDKVVAALGMWGIVEVGAAE